MRVLLSAIVLALGLSACVFNPVTVKDSHVTVNAQRGVQQ